MYAAGRTKMTSVRVNLNTKDEARTTRGLGELAQGKGRPGHARAKTSTQQKGKKRKGKKKKGTSGARKHATPAGAARAHTPRGAKARLRLQLQHF